MSGREILHSTNFDDGERHGWGEMGSERQFCDLVDDELTGKGKCLATRTGLNLRIQLECHQITLTEFKGRKVLVSFDLRVINPAPNFDMVSIDTGRNNHFWVDQPKPNSEWQRYSIPVDLTKETEGFFNIVVRYPNREIDTQAFFDNIVIESND
ncbi:hypothetical protein ACXR0M_19950 [Pseudomonas sp. Eth.TT006]